MLLTSFVTTINTSRESYGPHPMSFSLAPTSYSLLSRFNIQFILPILKSSIILIQFLFSISIKPVSPSFTFWCFILYCFECLILFRFCRIQGIVSLISVVNLTPFESRKRTLWGWQRKWIWHWRVILSEMEKAAVTGDDIRDDSSWIKGTLCLLRKTFCTKQVNMSVFILTMKSWWSPKQGVMSKTLGDVIVLFQFECETNCNKVLVGWP